jgi:hypothetical protein
MLELWLHLRNDEILNPASAKHGMIKIYSGFIRPASLSVLKNRNVNYAKLGHIRVVD